MSDGVRARLLIHACEATVTPAHDEPLEEQAARAQTNSGYARNGTLFPQVYRAAAPPGGSSAVWVVPSLKLLPPKKSLRSPQKKSHSMVFFSDSQRIQQVRNTREGSGNFWLGLGVFKQTKATGVAKCHLSVSLPVSRKSLGYSSE